MQGDGFIASWLNLLQGLADDGGEAVGIEVDVFVAFAGIEVGSRDFFGDEAVIAEADFGHEGVGEGRAIARAEQLDDDGAGTAEDEVGEVAAGGHDDAVGMMKERGLLLERVVFEEDFFEALVEEELVDAVGLDEAAGGGAFAGDEDARGVLLFEVRVVAEE